MLRTVIVDDEPLARERLKLMLSGEADVEIVGGAGDGDEALELLTAVRPDLVFLDIQMPGQTGLQVARRVGVDGLPHTIFLTAFKEYAVDAFDLEAVDYLTKPVDAARLRQALDRVRESMAAKDTRGHQARLAAMLDRLEQPRTQKAYATRLVEPDGPKDVLLAVADIDWIEASDYYSSVHAKQRTYLLRESLADLEQRLNPDSFVRVHRSALVNLEQVQEVHREGIREGTLTLRNGTSIRMSKAGRQRLRSMFEDAR